MNKVIKVAILGTGIVADMLFYAISISDYTFDICCVYDEKGEAHRFNGIEVKDLSRLTELVNSNVDYVFNCLSEDENFIEILKKIVSCSRIKDSTFIEKYLNSNQKMLLYERKIYKEFQEKYVSARVTVGAFTYGIPEILTFKDDDTKVSIGKFCSIASDVSIICGGLHRTDWISTYPFNCYVPDYSYIKGHPATKGDISIGNDVWIGKGVTILSGVKIGDGAVIAANATVSRDVEPYTIAGGVPAKVIKKRFSDDIINKLLEIKWWNWDYEKIYDVIPLLQSGNIDELILNF